MRRIRSKDGLKDRFSCTLPACAVIKLHISFIVALTRTLVLNTNHSPHKPTNSSQQIPIDSEKSTSTAKQINYSAEYNTRPSLSIPDFYPSTHIPLTSSRGPRHPFRSSHPFLTGIKFNSKATKAYLIMCTAPEAPTKEAKPPTDLDAMTDCLILCRELFAVRELAVAEQGNLVLANHEETGEEAWRTGVSFGSEARPRWRRTGFVSRGGDYLVRD